MFCKFCGNEIDVDTRFCPNCGQALESTQVSNNPRPITQSSEREAYRPAQFNIDALLYKIKSSSERWKAYMIVVFALWAVSLFPLFADWISLDFFGYYSDSISIFSVSQYWQEEIDYLDGDMLSYLEGETLAAAKAILTAVKLLNAYVILFCICSAALLVLSLLGFYKKNRKVFSFATALSSVLILFPLISLIVIPSALENDLLTSAILSFTAAPYILIILNIAAIALTRIAKNIFSAENTSDSQVDCTKGLYGFCAKFFQKVKQIINSLYE